MAQRGGGGDSDKLITVRRSDSKLIDFGFGNVEKKKKKGVNHYLGEILPKKLVLC